MNAAAKNSKRLRKQAGLPRETPAERLHTTRQWETAKTRPDILRPWQIIVTHAHAPLRSGPVSLSGLYFFPGLNR
ncbi:MAG: hypothetical protein Q4C45_06690 [Oscillospiraceae bacterium]|nr:hypothetical protein [Oscillospiraceae bacterium]